MSFTTETEPARRVAIEIMPGIRRLVAQNPGPMTYFGTNTYLIDRPEGAIVLDPGPADRPEHVDDIMGATNGKISLILLSHSHHDHHGLLDALRRASGAPTCGFGHGADPSVSIDRPIADGESIAGLTAIHTPGHAADHVCFALADGVVFTADHIMAWSTTVVADMAAYFHSLDRMLARSDAVYLPGHGPVLRDPAPYMRALKLHRREREAALVAALNVAPQHVSSLTDQLYRHLDAKLRRAAERNVRAHLVKLEGEGRVTCSGELWHSVA